MNTESMLLISQVNKSFNNLSEICENRQKYMNGSLEPDCHHPDMDFKNMLCDIHNCPLLD
jgi:hypothetical protein